MRAYKRPWLKFGGEKGWIISEGFNQVYEGNLGCCETPEAIDTLNQAIFAYGFQHGLRAGYEHCAQKTPLQDVFSFSATIEAEAQEAFLVLLLMCHPYYFKYLQTPRFPLKRSKPCPQLLIPHLRSPDVYLCWVSYLTSLLRIIMVCKLFTDYRVLSFVSPRCGLHFVMYELCFLLNIL